MSSYAPGVSATKDAVHAATKNDDPGLYRHSFVKIFPVKRKFKNPVQTLHMDGAGTVTAWAYMWYRLTGDISLIHNIMINSIVMNLDDVISSGFVNGEMILAGVIDQNIFAYWDPNRFREENEAEADMILAEMIKGQNNYVSWLRDEIGIDIKIVGGETSDQPDTIRGPAIINHGLHAVTAQRDIIDNGRIKPGDYIVGLASNGRAIWEPSDNGGMRSNGWSLTRNVLCSDYRTLFPNTYYVGPGKPIEEAYYGTKRMKDFVTTESGTQLCLGEYAGQATRTYAPIFKKLYDEKRIWKNISGVVHNSGGANFKCVKYLSKPMAIVKDNMFSTPPLFRLIQKDLKLSDEKILNAFNLGNGMDVYLRDIESAEAVMEAAESYGIKSQLIGRVEKAKDDMRRVIIDYNGKSYARTA